MTASTSNSWLEPAFDAPAIREIDRWAIEDRGIASLTLMENAGAALARVAEEAAAGGEIVIACGKGNNGGDGLVAARLLAEWGHSVRALLLAGQGDLSADAEANLRSLPAAVTVIDATGLGEAEIAAAIAPAALLIDAILGTGSSGEPRGAVAIAICALNSSSAPILACDIASGVDASTGEVAGAAIDADLTVTFHTAKLGHLIAPGKQAAGDLVVADIGIPADYPGAASSGTIGLDVLAGLPRRGAASSKFSSGSVLVVGGSRGLTGAPALAARSAMRAGAGYVVVGVPASLEPILEAKLTEPMTLALIESAQAAGAVGAGAIGQVIEASERADAVLLGPGLGRGEEVTELVLALLARVEAPLILDADGLNSLGGDLAALTSRRQPTVLTPHERELARLLGTGPEEISRHRLASARSVAAATGAILVLKGDDTLVLGAGGIGPAISSRPSPGLATAGTGDVLAGMVAALIARGADPYTASCASVYAHARAGRIAARRLGSVESVVASDVIEAVPAALAAGDER